MNTLELKNYLHRIYTENVQIIVCAIDELPIKQLKKNTNYGLVVNLSRKTDSGSHWIGIYIDNENGVGKKRKGCGKGFYFDSYGFVPKSWYLIEFLKKNCRNVEYCHQQLQQIQSKVCGMYAASFIVHMANGQTYKHFLDKFSKNLVINDLFIAKIFNYYARN